MIDAQWPHTGTAATHSNITFFFLFRTFEILSPLSALRILPNRSQFFTYESLTLSCGQQENSSGWTLKRNTSQYINQECFNSKRTNKSWRFFDVLYQSDSGEYWCESAAGECSDPVSITVTRLAVILESPALPVTEGDDVTLRCRVENVSSSGLTVDFYKDGVLFRSSSTGSMTIHGVSAADGGLYRCTISGAGGSPQSWLTVRGEISLTLASILLAAVPEELLTGKREVEDNIYTLSKSVW
uniref:Ig-like domain-containing protein n=1 Tax=Mola mola TaxID=94237 RepID=A0A3Q3WKI9_MOLML